MNAKTIDEWKVFLGFKTRKKVINMVLNGVLDFSGEYATIEKKGKTFYRPLFVDVRER